MSSSALTSSTAATTASSKSYGKVFGREGGSKREHPCPDGGVDAFHMHLNQARWVGPGDALATATVSPLHTPLPGLQQYASSVTEY